RRTAAAATAPKTLARRFLGALARPFDADTGRDLGMMATQSDIMQAADSYGGMPTYAATQRAQARTQMASYGGYPYTGNWRRH
ncbi:hypothetical protein MNEG_5507, partial [Monoraphidium neglectum]